MAFNPARLLPTPKRMEVVEGVLRVPASASALHAPFEEFSNTLRVSLNKIFCTEIAEGEGVVLKHDASIKPGAYAIDTTGEQMVLSAADDEGIVYAIATALQMISLSGEEIVVPMVRIEDAPDKSYRGLMVDLARKWHPASKVLHYIDICFMLKLRYLHLHFMDTQSYTLPSRAFPKLCEPYRHYSYEDIAEFCAYAKARGVILIPEFEVPGHASVLVRQYPEIFSNVVDDEECATLVTEGGEIITSNALICAGNPKTSDAVRTLLRELCEIFPDSPYIHIGGDEANVKAWNFCTHCRAYMKEHGIKDERELYSEFTGRVAQMVFDLGRTPIVWEGFPKEGVHYIPKDTIVIAWESHYHLAPDLLDAGFQIINASWQPLYIVPKMHLRWYAKDILNWNVYNWQHWWKNSPARLNPIHVPPTDRVLGAQICAWEGIYEQEVGLVMENCAALSERLWNLERCDDDDACYRRISAIVTRTTLLIQDV
ncbi:MAG: family 20 glycosylhydrolase [Clostridia bacterium]|nr:family 20 glycosylhydrolase [Clostridia bacterium]